MDLQERMRFERLHPKAAAAEKAQIAARAEEAKLKQEEAERMAQAKAEKHRERAFQVFLVFLTVAATLFVEHFMEIVEIVKKLFHL